MTELDDDFHATTESIAADASELKAIEEHKDELDPMDPEAARLSDKSLRVARRIVAKAVAERDIAEESSDPS